LLFNFLTCKQFLDEEGVAKVMLEDITKIKGRAVPSYLKPYYLAKKDESEIKKSHFNKRQSKHMLQPLV
jgi:hypothetical protein